MDSGKFFLSDMVQEKILKQHKVDGALNVADALTESVPTLTLESHTSTSWAPGPHSNPSQALAA